MEGSLADAETIAADETTMTTGIPSRPSLAPSPVPVPELVLVLVLALASCWIHILVRAFLVPFPCLVRSGTSSGVGTSVAPWEQASSGVDPSSGEGTVQGTAGRPVGPEGCSGRGSLEGWPWRVCCCLKGLRS